MKYVFSQTIAIVTFLLSVSHSITAQTAYNVSVSSNVFTPKDITINAGDTVIWTNTGGTHNVNGTQGTYPSNPESFGNSVGSGWVYTFVFTIPGFYDYQCDPHVGLGMTGSVTVQNSNAVAALPVEQDGFKVYPNPFNDDFIIEMDERFLFSHHALRLEITDISGRGVLFIDDMVSDRFAVDASVLDPGIYFYKVIGNEGVAACGKLVAR